MHVRVLDIHRKGHSLELLRRVNRFTKFSKFKPVNQDYYGWVLIDSV